MGFVWVLSFAFITSLYLLFMCFCLFVFDYGDICFPLFFLREAMVRRHI